MRPTKRVLAQKDIIREKALQIHRGFIDMVFGNIQKIGMEEVSKSYMSINGPVGPYWLKEALGRVLYFIEKMQIREATPPLIDQSNHEHFEVKVAIAKDDDTPAQVPGNRISKYIEI